MEDLNNIHAYSVINTVDIKFHITDDAICLSELEMGGYY